MKPASIAVGGASQRITRATRVVTNLQRFGYAGRIYPINPKYSPDIAHKTDVGGVRVGWATRRRCARRSARCSTRFAGGCRRPGSRACSYSA